MTWPTNGKPLGRLASGLLLALAFGAGQLLEPQTAVKLCESWLSNETLTKTPLTVSGLR